MTIKVGLGLSTTKDPLQAVREATAQARLKLSKENINLAVVFSSIEFAHPIVLKTITTLVGPVNIVGCSGLAIISNQGIFKYGLVIMLLSLPKDVYLNTACVKQINAQSITNAGELLGEKLMDGFKNIRRDLGMLFCDGLMPQSSTIIYGLQEKLGRSFPLVGASASNNPASLKTYLYFNQEVYSDAACGLLWGGKLNFGLGIKHGWKFLGKARTITKSAGNVIYEIDAAPAARVYEEYLDCDLLKLRKELKYISIFYPIGIYLPGEEEYLLRNILSIEDDGSLHLHGNAPQGSQIRLMIGTKESCLQATEQSVEEVKKGLLGRPGNFIFVFDSLSRYILLGRQAKKELDIIKEGLGQDIPMIGLYTLGEQAPLRAIGYRGRAYFHNQTITILAIGG
jgi:hypothetical protein